MYTEKNKSDIPPEGGLRGWLVAWGSFLALFCTSGFLNAHVILYYPDIDLTSAKSMPLPFRVVYSPLTSQTASAISMCSMASFGTGASILALWLSFNYHPSHAGITVFALVYEFVSGSFVSLLMPCVAKAGSLETLGLQFGSFQMIIGVRSSSSSRSYMSLRLTAYQLSRGVAYHGCYIKPSREHLLLRAATLVG
ncbi:hypothetical protein P875_00010202 [Aspergillus parasiticus SU-1]|uniref:Major facilitator superfamily domain-containing protein n=1 Tax=Aspergillus parasiticus (strain ATCC 56775 / NRRL 5862 / SRRC 143 / SU-1) TaxID=1403190 RepID=A0A0F0IFN7_ASPPU|nr:hypothetical protein P875_00010202 [Aspergillus parasiticus SU-1]